jgi:phosphoglycerate dehydrogenase-like enzyme
LKSALLEKYDHVKFNDEGLVLSGDNLVAFMSGFDRAIVGLEKIDAEVLDRLPDLKVISKYGVGLDSIDLQALKRRNVRLGWKGGVNRRSVSELTIAFMIMLLRLLPQANQDVRNGKWTQVTGGLLTGKTVGIIGCGHVGKDLVRLLEAFDCQIRVFDIRDYLDFYQQYNVQPVSLDVLLRESDIITLHVPLDESTRGILNIQNMSSIKKDALLINTARGELVDEIVLKRLLQDSVLAGAAFDVFGQEPPGDQELLNLPNFFATPHIGGSSVEAIHAMGLSAIEGLAVNAVPE